MHMDKKTVTLKRTYLTPDTDAVQVKLEGCIASSLQVQLGDLDNNELEREDL